MRPVIITIGLPIVIMQIWTLLNECPTLFVDQVVFTLLDGRCVVEHDVCCVDELSIGQSGAESGAEWTVQGVSSNRSSSDSTICYPVGALLF